MQTTFLNQAGAVLFVRDDMEQGNWTQEEYTVNATFPYVADKPIQRGQRMAFRDPATGNMEFFEVRNVTNIEPEHYQQIIAEHIAVSELSDEHMNSTEITDETASVALGKVLSGTLWSVGTIDANPTSSADIARGSVWQAVASIASNWNVYIVPRVETNARGEIVGRLLDIVSTEGTWRGLRLSVDKNMADSSVVFDDSEVLTALYGYGGNVDKPQGGKQDDKTEELTFADEVWTATNEHPAKPAGQTYLEDPAATAAYGRNGRPRFGYYQNGDIKDAAVLLEKTWEALQETNKPKISITGTVSDLYRLGYNDEPIRLHDMAIVELRPTGEMFYLQIIKNDVDLIDPSATRPEIGSYIQNIVYINREANKGGGGGGGGRGQTNQEDNDAKTFAALEKTNSMIGMVVGTRNGEQYIKTGEIVLAINESTGETEARISADKIFLDGETSVAALLSGTAEINILDVKDLYVEQGVFDEVGTDLVKTDGIEFGEYNVSWQTYTARYCSLSTAHSYLYGNASYEATGRTYGSIVIGHTDTTIHYLGRG